MRLDGHVASALGFVSQPRILDAASEFFVTVLGAELGACVKLVVTFAVKRERYP